MIKIDEHVGVAIAGLTSDARVLRWAELHLEETTTYSFLVGSNFMRQLAMQSRMLYARPIPVGRIVQSIADRKLSTMDRLFQHPD